MQLVAYGAQDIYLTGQPQITFFKSVYRRHTNFAMEAIQQTINGSKILGQRAEVTITRNGDMVLGAFVQLDCDTATAAQKMWSYENFCLFDHVELEIGGQRIDTIYGDWMTLYAELCYRQGYSIDPTVAIGDGFGSDALATTLNSCKVVAEGGCINIPLLFYFNNNPGLAIPLISLQYHEVRMILHFAPTARVNFAGAAGVGTGTMVQLQNSIGSAANVDTAVSNMRFYVEYAYLDTTERRKFAQNAHEYLITQHQRIDETATANTRMVGLNSFNHPVKYIAWRFSYSEANFLTCPTYQTAKITLNGQDRMTERPSSYFENMQVHQHWPCGGNQLTWKENSPGTGNGCWSVYSFAARPAEHQPSGTCNFSRIDISNLEFNNVDAAGTGATKVTVHAENYNVLRVMSGMGGLAYSN